MSPDHLSTWDPARAVAQDADVGYSLLLLDNNWRCLVSIGMQVGTAASQVETLSILARFIMMCLVTEKHQAQISLVPSVSGDFQGTGWGLEQLPEKSCTLLSDSVGSSAAAWLLPVRF